MNVTSTEFIVTLLISFLVVYIVRKCVLNSVISKEKSIINLKGYTLFYTDQKSKIKNKNLLQSKILISERYNLSGKPDYIYKRKIGKRMIPVEIKSGTIESAKLPRYGDFMQLIAYFVLIEEVYKIKPRIGYLVYKDFMFRIPNKKIYKNALFKIIEEMNYMLKTGKGKCTPSYNKCKNCIYYSTVCEFV